MSRLEALAEELYAAGLEAEERLPCKRKQYPTSEVEPGAELLLKHYQSLGLPDETPFGLPDAVEVSSHEIAHWYCAAPSRRGDKFFGLGNPNGWCEGQSVSRSYAEDEEMDASILGILIERHVGANWPYTVSLHSWTDYVNWRPIEDVLRRLLRKGLIDATGRPAMMGKEQFNSSRAQKEKERWNKLRW